MRSCARQLEPAPFEARSVELDGVSFYMAEHDQEVVLTP
ncbi:Hypothetical protein A7982_08101 [Minicystis rosea]|nr:Hypothetical protein A7982_08101 [Minicystis rosea]